MTEFIKVKQLIYKRAKKKSTVIDLIWMKMIRYTCKSPNTVII